MRVRGNGFYTLMKRICTYAFRIQKGLTKKQRKVHKIHLIKSKKLEVGLLEINSKIDRFSLNSCFFNISDQKIF